MSDIFDAMYANHTINQAVEQVLKQTTCFFQADAAYLIEISENGKLIEKIHEYTEPGIRTIVKKLEKLEKLEKTSTELFRTPINIGHEPLFCTDADQLPEEIKAVFPGSKFHTLFQFPVMIQDQLAPRPVGVPAEDPPGKTDGSISETAGDLPQAVGKESGDSV